MNIAQEHIEKLDLMLKASKRPLIVTHMHPDGDALGSSFGMKHYLDQRAGSDTFATVLLCSHPSDSIAFIAEGCAPGTVLFSDEDDYSEAVAGADLLLCLDFNNFSRTDRLQTSLEGISCPKVLIDHHVQPSVESFDLVFSDPGMSSASEYLFWILDLMPDVSGDVASLPYSCRLAMMAGMTTDTNNFANSATDSTFRMASRLIATGVDRGLLIERLYNSCRENRLRMIGYLLENRMKITPYGLAYTLLDEQTFNRFGMREGELEGYVNMPLTIDEVKMSIFIRGEADRMRVSIRSKRGVSANQCSRRYFGGGGHEQAAGGRLPLYADLDELEKYVLDSTAEFFEVKVR